MYLHVTVHSSPRSWTRLCRTHLLVKTSVSCYHCTVFFVYCVRSSFRVCRWTCEVDKKTFVRAVNRKMVSWPHERRWFPRMEPRCIIAAGSDSRHGLPASAPNHRNRCSLGSLPSHDSSLLLSQSNQPAGGERTG
jgi:hypothetical protein